MHVTRLDSAARLILRNHDLARDAVQEGFIRAWRSLPTLRDPDAFDGWLRTLVTRACLDIVRRRGRRAIEVDRRRRVTSRATPVDGPERDDLAATGPVTARSGAKRAAGGRPLRKPGGRQEEPLGDR